MAISAVGTLKSTAGGSTLAVSPATLGNALALAVKVASGTVTVTSVTGGGATWALIAGPYVDTSGNAHTHYLYLGTVTTPGSATITVGFSGAATADIDAQEFTNGNTATTWAVDSGQVGFLDNASSGTLAFPTLTATGAGELYVGHGRCPSGGPYSGAPTGFVVTADADYNPYLYGTGVSGSVSPTVTSGATPSYNIGALITASTGPVVVHGSASLSASSGLSAAGTVTYLDKHNSFEGGTPGTAITPANSASGGDAFSSVDTGTGAPQYSTAQAMHATTSMMMTGAVGTTAKEAVYGGVAPASGPLYTRAYIRLHALPSGTSGTWRWMRFSNAGTVAGWVTVNDQSPGPQGTIALEDAATTHLAGGVSTTVLAIDTWYRVEVEFSNTGSATARLYLGDSSTLLETWTGTGLTQTATDVGWGQEHDASTDMAGTAWIDDVATSATTWLGASGIPAIVHGTVSMDAASDMTVAGAVEIHGSATMSSASDLTATGTLAVNGAANLSSASDMTVAATQVMFASVHMSGASDMTVTVGVASVHMSGVSSMSVTATVSTPPPAPPPTPPPTLPSTPPLTWRLFLADTVTGKVVADLPIASTLPTWTRTLNGAGTLSASVPLYPPLPADTMQYLREPWRWTLGLAYGGWVAQAGMLTATTVDDTVQPPVVALTTTTLWDFFSKKRLAFTPADDITQPAANIVFGPTSPSVSYRAMSWQAVAVTLMTLAQGGGSGYRSLPIDLPDPTTGTATITYTATDLATVGQRLTEITQQAGGPEIEFSPEFSDDTQTYLRWRMKIGAPRLGQLGYPHAFDYQRALQSVTVTLDGTAMTFHVYAKGQDNRSAKGGALALATSKDVSNPYEAAAWPWLETADTSHSSETSDTVLTSYADADVTTNMVPIHTVAATIRDDALAIDGKVTGSPSLDLLSVGDTATFTLCDHPSIADGTYGVRIVGIGNGRDAWTSGLTVQWLGAVT